MYKFNFPSIKESYFIMLCLLNCALLLSIGAGHWTYPKTTAFIILMIGLQFLSRKFWFTTFLSFIPFYFAYLPLFPRLTNHGNLQVFIGIILMIFVVLKFKKIKENTINHEIITNVFIYCLITIYFVAGFHKINAGYFDLDSSCVNYVGSNFNSFLFGEGSKLPLSLIRVSQMLTFAFEMIVPFGLLFHNTRKLSAWLLVAFHFYLSLCWFSNFSALAGFLICGCILNYEREKSYYETIIKGLKFYIFFSILSVVISFAISRLGLFDRTYIRLYNGVFFNMGWVIFFYILLKNSSFIKQKKLVTTIPLLFTLCILIWGSQAYIGLSNAGNLTMFSNLITEKSRNNHYIIDTNKTKIWSFEEDLVTMIDIPEHLKWQNSGLLDSYQLPLIEFKNQANQWVRKYDTIELTISHKGKIIHISDLKSSEYSKVEWWYNYIYFRRIPIKDINECLW